MDNLFYFIMGMWVVISSISLKKDYDMRKRLKNTLDEMDKIIKKQR